MLLRQDNADLRLTELGHKIGVVSEPRYRHMTNRRDAIDRVRSFVKSNNAAPDRVNSYLRARGTAEINRPERLAKVALRPEVSLADLLDAAGHRDALRAERHGHQEADETRGAHDENALLQFVETELKYAGYLDREMELVEKMAQLERWLIPDDFDYDGVNNITMEAREKLSRIRPDNLGQASRISGVSPSDISVLMVLLKKYPRRVIA